jgi:hypothetical protein
MLERLPYRVMALHGGVIVGGSARALSCHRATHCGNCGVEGGGADALGHLRCTVLHCNAGACTALQCRCQWRQWRSQLWPVRCHRASGASGQFTQAVQKFFDKTACSITQSERDHSVRAMPQILSWHCGNCIRIFIHPQLCTPSHDTTTA